ncbi:MAG: FtsX-like permease family protein [Chitinispirillaceae bacterium]|nr:FtsX-like permease family protein [Chitinispirillaceae bacterium]
MDFLFTISLRNLFRQRRRSILLGTAIMFGTAILVLANAFAHGISEVLFNEIVSYVAGHVSVSFTKGGNANNQIFHDGDRIRAIIKERVPSVKRVDEAIGVFARAIGNGKADNVVMVGMDPSGEGVDEKEMEKYAKAFTFINGSFDNLGDSTIENPVGLSVEKAKALNVKYGDVMRVRYTDIHGQTQAARLTVATIYKPSNVFMSVPIFFHVKTVRRLLGYGPHDVPQLYLIIDNPKRDAKRFADSLHAGLKPPLAVIDGDLSFRSETIATTLLCLRTDSASLACADSGLRLISQTANDSANRKKSVIVSSAFAAATGMKPGDTCSVAFEGKFDSSRATVRLIVTAIADTGAGIDGNVVLVNEKDFYKAFYDTWPKSTAAGTGPFRPDTTNGIYKALGGEWLLVPRSSTTKDMMKLYREIAQKGWRAIVVDVGSMYETASMVLNLEYALNLITFICVMLLFFIILIGVINTLRMTIRERTREIGTVRAIGMQRVDVRNSFLIETGLLALISAVVGTIVAFAAMWGLSRLTFKAGENPLGMLLVDGHLFFAPTAGAIVFFVVLIVGIAVVTAYFPARRAAKLSAADALRHFE